MTENDNLPGTPPEDSTPDAPAPAPKRRPRKPAAAVVEAGPDAVAADSSAAADAPRPRRRRSAAAEGPAADAPAGATVDAAATAEPGAREVRTDAETAAQPAEAAEGAVAEGAGEEGEGRRGRNRRRGRGKERGERPAGEEGAPRAAPVAPEVDAAEAAARFDEVLSGAYDAEAPEPDDEASLEAATKRVLRPDPDAPKLHKVLAQSGIGSRRDMEQLIADGAVTVNDEVAHIGMRIAFGDRIAVNGKPVRVRIHGGPARLLAYHKPAGEVVTFNDPEGRPTVFRRLPRLQHGKWQSVGRLDINTEGLLLFTTSGELANQLMHPRFGVEREYVVRVLGSLDDEQRARLLEGVEIDGQPAAFKSIEDGGGDGANRWYRVVITEGRNREVRKLFDKVGLAVSRLIRIRYGTVVLPRGLRRGVWVELGEQDLRMIRQLAAGPRAPGERTASDRPAG
ncbi:MAG TPA: pseudouridine synthase, partial [Methylibium sp.]|nr:pseudouridine synthase [Methylibium sp.]